MHVQPSDALPKIMLARYYGGNLPRFLSPDPVVDVERNLPLPQRWNRYTYVLNNPLNLWDPDGLQEAPPSQTDNAINTAWKVIKKVFKVRAPRGFDEAVKGATAANKGVAVGAAKNARDVAIDECASGNQGACDAADQLTDLVQGADADEGINEIIKYIYEKAEKKDEDDEGKPDEEEKGSDEKDGEDDKKNSYGIDPDGPYGPTPHPCQGMGPLCR